MAKIRLSRKAISDLDGIWDYTVETWSEEQAVIYYRQIYTYGLTVSSMKEWITKGISEPPRKAQKNQGNSLVLFVTD